MACKCENCSCPDTCACTGEDCKNNDCLCNCHGNHEQGE